MAQDVDHIQYRIDENSVYNSTLELLPYQFSGSENFIKLMYVISEMKQRLHDVIVDVAKFRLIETAYGQQLDNIGEELGVPRAGSTDEEYRILLRIRAYKRKSQGTRPDVIDLISRFTGTSLTGTSAYIGPNKTVDLYVTTPCFDVADIVDDILEILPVVTRVKILENNATVGAFGFDGDPSALGFSSANDRNYAEAGGLFKRIYETP